MPEFPQGLITETESDKCSLPQCLCYSEWNAEIQCISTWHINEKETQKINDIKKYKKSMALIEGVL